MFLKTLLASCAALLIGAAAPAQPMPESAAPNRIRAHVAFLASDLLEGRETGSRGHAIAAAYVAGEFQKLGLRPGGENGGWSLQVPLRRATHAALPTAVLTRNGHRIALVSGRDFGLRPSLVEKQRSIDADLVFVGHGISEPRLGVDDYAGLDVRGKIVVALEGTPAGLATDVAAHLASMKDEIAARKGAVGYVEIDAERPGRSPLSGVERRNRPLLHWVRPTGDTGRSEGTIRAEMSLSPQTAERLFEGAPKKLATVRAESLRGTVAGFPLAGRLRIHSASDWQDFASPEVIGVLPGSDPALADEFIVLMGHLDHLGINSAALPGQDAILNGAIDNAGGIATMLEAARSFVSSGVRPRRSVMFIATTGEERGLLGADYFAAHPTVPIDRVVGLVNLDMPLLLYRFTDVIAFGAEHSTIARSVAEAGRSMGVAVSPDPMPEQSLFVRSDHYPFVKRGVPAVFLMTGHANGGKQAWDDYLSNVYHRPNDDLEQPIDWAAGARFAELNYRIARALADAPERPRWYADSYFGQAFAPAQPKASR